MGINLTGARFILHAQRTGVCLADTVTLGRQTLYVTVQDFTKLFASFGLNLPMPEARKLYSESNGYSEAFFRRLGAARVESIDASAYENASIIHDMNLPIPSGLRESFTAVVDGGTLEHIFNFPTAIQNCMDMLRIGGHFLAITPANNFMGHGFYQFSPELYFRVLCPENGFSDTTVFLSECCPPYDWFEASDPEKVRSRVLLTNYCETYMMVVSRKERSVTLSQFPQQSDYVRTWDSSAEGAGHAPREKSLMRQFTPDTMKAVMYHVVRCLPMLRRRRRFPQPFYQAIKRL